uniref:Disintegrin domain-containing protein n=1 Tax=Rhabditophanes sp. KR3021 TaxID=114890 RepID=A0AC35TNS4_9BILA
MCTIINLSQTNLCNDKIKCPSGQTCDEMTLTCYNTPNSGPPPVNGPPGKLGQVCPAEGDKCEGGAVCSKKKYCVTPCTKDSDCGSTASAGDCTLLANGNGLKGCINQNINNLCKGNPPKCPFGNTCNLYTMSCQRSKNIGQECSQTSDCLSRLVCNPTITDGTKSVCTAACDNDSECTLGNSTPKKCSKSSSPESLATGYCEINAKMQCHKNNECSKRCNIHILQCNN